MQNNRPNFMTGKMRKTSREMGILDHIKQDRSMITGLHIAIMMMMMIIVVVVVVVVAVIRALGIVARTSLLQ
jgi:heme/copper-type cytochrome/quinol oxidase subunit 2